MNFEIEPYRLAREREDEWALMITPLSEFGTGEQPFHGGPIFASEHGAALRCQVGHISSWPYPKDGSATRGVNDQLEESSPSCQPL